MTPPAPRSEPPPTRPPSYSLEGTEVHELTSKVNGKNYKLIVGPPYEPEPGRRFATLYVLDGYWDFILLEALRGALHYDQAIPDVMIVGVAYAGEKPDLDSLRASDYTPTPDESRPESDGTRRALGQRLARPPRTRVPHQISLAPEARLGLGRERRRSGETPCDARFHEANRGEPSK